MQHTSTLSRKRNIALFALAQSHRVCEGLDMETTTPETATESVEVLEDIAKVYDINIAEAEKRLAVLRDKANGYRQLAAIGRRFGGSAYPSSKPAGWEVTVLVEGLPKRGSGATLTGAQPLDLKWTKSGNVYSAKVPEGMDFDQLLVDGRKMVRARFPNSDPKNGFWDRGYRDDNPGMAATSQG